MTLAIRAGHLPTLGGVLSEPPGAILRDPIEWTCDRNLSCYSSRLKRHLSTDHSTIGDRSVHGVTKLARVTEEILVRSPAGRVLLARRPITEEIERHGGAASSDRLLGQVHRLFHFGAIGAMSDAQLLDRFVSRRDEAAEAAFEELVIRHGPMVLRVCRGVLHDAHDAEDAFQAVFLVLASRAGSIRRSGSVASWLFGVGAPRGHTRPPERRASASARPARRRADLGERAPRETTIPTGRSSTRRLDGLPERLRAPVVLCYLQGLTYAAAAHQLGVSEVAVRGRLARARERLRHRLTRRGVTVPAGLLVAGAAGQAQAAIPVSLIQCTIRIALGFVAGTHGRRPGAGSVEFHAAQPGQSRGGVPVRRHRGQLLGLACPRRGGRREDGAGRRQDAGIEATTSSTRRRVSADRLGAGRGDRRAGPGGPVDGHARRRDGDEGSRSESHGHLGEGWAVPRRSPAWPGAGLDLPGPGRLLGARQHEIAGDLRAVAVAAGPPEGVCRPARDRLAVPAHRRGREAGRRLHSSVHAGQSLPVRSQ